MFTRLTYLSQVSQAQGGSLHYAARQTSDYCLTDFLFSEQVDVVFAVLVSDWLMEGQLIICSTQPDRLLDKWDADEATSCQYSLCETATSFRKNHGCNSPPCPIWISPNILRNNPLPITMTEHLLYFIAKFKIMCLSASWLSIAFSDTDLMLQFCLP